MNDTSRDAHQDITIQSDIAYLGPDRAEKLDAYLPSSAYRGPHPAILLIHGGGWRLGDKADNRERDIGTTLARHGYAVFSINYLLNETTKEEGEPVRLHSLAWPQSFTDCKSALRFLRAEAQTYHLDPDRIATMGGSAGGHLALLLAATAEHPLFNREGLHTEQSNAVTCALNFYGDYDIRGRTVSPFAGASDEVKAQHEADASPVTWIDTNMPPVFITHGARDTIIPVERSRRLVEHLDKHGLDYWYVEIAGAGHGYDLHLEQMNLEPSVLTFLHKHLGKPIAG